MVKRAAVVAHRSLGGARLWLFCALETFPLRVAKDKLSALVQRVHDTHERVTITRNGQAAAVLISPDDLAVLGEALDVLSDPALFATGAVALGLHARRRRSPLARTIGRSTAARTASSEPMTRTNSRARVTAV